jgi:hypothetical protein
MEPVEYGTLYPEYGWWRTARYLVTEPVEYGTPYPEYG